MNSAILPVSSVSCLGSLCLVKVMEREREEVRGRSRGADEGRRSSIYFNIERKGVGWSVIETWSLRAPWPRRPFRAWSRALKSTRRGRVWHARYCRFWRAQRHFGPVCSGWKDPRLFQVGFSRTEPCWIEWPCGGGSRRRSSGCWARCLSYHRSLSPHQRGHWRQRSVKACVRAGWVSARLPRLWRWHRPRAWGRSRWSGCSQWRLRSEGQWARAEEVSEEDRSYVGELGVGGEVVLENDLDVG